MPGHANEAHRQKLPPPVRTGSTASFESIFDSLRHMVAPEPTSRLIAELPSANRRLLDTVTQLSDEASSARRCCPAGASGHVLTHLARNADALVNLCDWALTGVRKPMYVSAEAREADIGEGAPGRSRSRSEDIAAAEARLLERFEDLPLPPGPRGRAGRAGRPVLRTRWCRPAERAGGAPRRPGPRVHVRRRTGRVPGRAAHLRDRPWPADFPVVLESSDSDLVVACPACRCKDRHWRQCGPAELGAGPERRERAGQRLPELPSWG